MNGELDREEARWAMRARAVIHDLQGWQEIVTDAEVLEQRRVIEWLEAIAWAGGIVPEERR